MCNETIYLVVELVFGNPIGAFRSKEIADSVVLKLHGKYVVLPVPLDPDVTSICNREVIV